MELPFAVDSSSQTSSLIAASTQGSSLVEDDDFDLIPVPEDAPPERSVLSWVLSGPTNAATPHLRAANAAVAAASVAQQKGSLVEALQAHTEAAKEFHQAAVVLQSTRSVSEALALLSQSQAKAALGLQKLLKLPVGQGHRERLRAAVRGAIKNPEADMSASIFMGKPSEPPPVPAAPTYRDKVANPVDEIMELERELRNMDMAMEVGNSIASLESRSQKMKSSMIDGSFMVVPPGSNSFLSTPSRPRAPVPSRKNRVQASQSTHRPAPAPPKPSSLESSWWGGASQILSSSVISLASGPVEPAANPTANAKQLMRLMDSLKTLGDENANLLKQVEGAEAARQESRAVKEQMKRFQQEYTKRFASLKAALEKFRDTHPESQNQSGMNPVTTSEFFHSSAASEQLQRKEQLIRKLTADLKREKDELKRVREQCTSNEATLRKYESFYREVKARSAQKAAQRQREQQQSR